MLKGGYSARIWLLLEDKPCVNLPVKQRWIQAEAQPEAWGTAQGIGK